MLAIQPAVVKEFHTYEFCSPSASVPRGDGRQSSDPEEELDLGTRLNTSAGTVPSAVRDKVREALSGTLQRPADSQD